MSDLELQTSYVLECFHSETQCVVNWYLLDEINVKNLLAGLGWDELEIDEIYSLGATERSVLEENLQRKTNVSADEFWIRRSIWTDFLSYRIHTNRELQLMLNGEKPLSVFVDFHPGDPNEIPEEIFDPYVKGGRFCTQQYIMEPENDQSYALRYVHYSMPNEKWRMDAYMKIMKDVRQNGASSDADKKEGSLLGYSDDENEEFVYAKADYAKNISKFIDNYNSLRTVFKREADIG